MRERERERERGGGERGEKRWKWLTSNGYLAALVALVALYTNASSHTRVYLQTIDGTATTPRS
jgi:hypothetical protein